MTFFRLFPVILSALLLGAHFFRAGLTYLAVAIVLFPVMLLMKRACAATPLRCHVPHCRIVSSSV